MRARGSTQARSWSATSRSRDAVATIATSASVASASSRLGGDADAVPLPAPLGERPAVMVGTARPGGDDVGVAAGSASRAATRRPTPPRPTSTTRRRRSCRCRSGCLAEHDTGQTKHTRCGWRAGEPPPRRSSPTIVRRPFPMTATFRAGAARLALEPPLGLPMVGFVRQPWRGRGHGWPLEVTAMALERDGERAILCGVDLTILRRRAMTELLRAHRGGHRRLPRRRPGQPQPHAPRPDRRPRRRALRVRRLPRRGAPAGRAVDRRRDGEDRGRLPAGVRAARAGRRGVGGRRGRRVREPPRARGGRPDRARLEPGGAARPARDVAAGPAPGRQRRSRRRSRGAATRSRRATTWTCTPPTSPARCGRPCGPTAAARRSSCRARPATCCRASPSPTEEREAERVGRRLGAGLARGARRPRRLAAARAAQEEASMVPIIAYRVEDDRSEAPALASASRERAPSRWSPCRRGRDRAPCARTSTSASPRPRRRPASSAGEARHRRGPLGARDGVRRRGRCPAGGAHSGADPRAAVGDGVLVTGPGEVFTEIGLAVKERSPGRPTAYCGYTNGCIGYFSSASEYALRRLRAGHLAPRLRAARPSRRRLRPAAGRDRRAAGRGALPRRGAVVRRRRLGGVRRRCRSCPDDAPRHPGDAGMPGEPRWSATTLTACALPSPSRPAWRHGPRSYQRRQPCRL